MIQRLRPAHSPEKLKEIYSQPHSHTSWVDHVLRVDATVAAGNFLLTHYDPYSPKIADLSCGDGAIVAGLRQSHTNLCVEGSTDVFLGDFAPGYPIEGPIEETLDQIPKVDLFVLSETLEHLDNPLEVLSRIRQKTSMLLLSTPISEPLDSGNLQHYWSWDIVGVGSLLESADFTPTLAFTLSLPTYYDYQIWGCL